ncbi:MAG: glutaredoxin [Verrucomicrobiota bacterium]
MSQTAPKIVIYLKTFCGWSQGVRDSMRKYRLAYEEKDIIKTPAFRREMEQLTGQALAPCVEIDGHMLVDVSGEEVEKWLIQNEYVRKDGTPPDAPNREVRIVPTAKAKEVGKARSSSKPEKVRFFD